jgi:hypothetical protein
MVEEFRADFAKHAHDEELLALVEYLNQHSKEFCELWQEPPTVHRKFPSEIRVMHPTRGPLLFQQMGMRLDHYSDLMLVFHKPKDEETKRALQQIQCP